MKYIQIMLLQIQARFTLPHQKQAQYPFLSMAGIAIGLLLATTCNWPCVTLLTGKEGACCLVTRIQMQCAPRWRWQVPIPPLMHVRKAAQGNPFRCLPVLCHVDSETARSDCSLSAHSILYKSSGVHTDALPCRCDLWRTSACYSALIDNMAYG